MAEPFEELIRTGTESTTAGRGRRATKVAFVLLLLALALILGVMTGSAALKGIGNAFGFGLDADHCALYQASSCSSVSLSEINRVTKAGLPRSSVIETSSWNQTFKTGDLGALIKVDDTTWRPPAGTYDLCQAADRCSGKTPSSFADNDIVVSGEYTELTPRNPALQRHLYLGTDAEGTEWVAVEFRLNK